MSEKELIKEMNLSFGSSIVCKIAKGDKFSFIEMNSVIADGSLYHYCYMARNDEVEEELDRIRYNNRRYGVRFIYCDYSDLTMKKLQ